jgi:D-lactate dehydrogenase
MLVAVFNAKSYDRDFLSKANADYGHELVFFESHLTQTTAKLAEGFPAVCVFINDLIDRTTLELLKSGGTELVATRSAGFNHIDLKAAHDLGICVVRVPAYSPYAVAEHTIGLILTLNRKIHRAYNRVREANFSIEGLLGFDLHGSTAGIIGTGKIGMLVCKALHGLGCRLLAHDPYQNPDCLALGVEYADLPELFAQSDIISLHCPLTPDSYHLINQQTIAQVKTGVMLINTSRGGLVDTNAVIQGLKSGKIGYLGLDVYEQEADLFFEDLSDVVIQDDVFQRLLTFPNVVITGHQAFFTRQALANIADTTLANIRDYETTKSCPNQVKSN